MEGCSAGLNRDMSHSRGDPALGARALHPLQVARLEGWYKQRDNKMYPAWAYCLPTTILRLPYSLLVATLWCCIVYYPVGLAPEPGRHALHSRHPSLQPNVLLGLCCACQHSEPGSIPVQASLRCIGPQTGQIRSGACCARCAGLETG